MALTKITTEFLAAMFFERFKIMAMPFQNFSTDFSSASAKKGQKIIARVGKTPSAPQDYDSTEGFFPTPDDAKDLLEDVDVTMDQFKTVPITLPLADTIEASINLIEGEMQSAAEVLGKAIMDHALSKILAANFSESSEFAAADSDYDMLEDVRKDLNAVGASKFGRFGMVSPDVFTALDGDTRITSRDFRGQMQDEAYGHFVGLKGFGDIWEYPDFPDNSENLSGFFGTKNAVTVATRVPSDVTEYVGMLGAVQTLTMTPITDPDTGITLLFLTSQDAKKGDLRMAVSAIYGAAAGSRGGSAGDSMDYAGHRLTTP